MCLFVGKSMLTFHLHLLGKVLAMPFNGVSRRQKLMELSSVCLTSHEAASYMHQRPAGDDLLAEASWDGSLASSPALARMGGRPHAAQAPAHQWHAQNSPQWAQTLPMGLGFSQGTSTLAAEGAALASTGLSMSTACSLTYASCDPGSTLGHSPACRAAGLVEAGAIAGSGCGAASLLGGTSSCSISGTF